MKKFTHLWKNWIKRIYFNWQICEKGNIITTILFFTVISILVYLIIDLKKIKIEHAKEIWKLNKYYREKEEELNFDRRLFDKELDTIQDFDFYYFREKGIR